MSVIAPGATTPASGPGSIASPVSKGNTSTPVPPASNSTLPCGHIVNGTDPTNSTLSSPGVLRPGSSLTNASLPSACPGQTNATNATTALLNSTVFGVPLPATPTATPSTRLTPTSDSYPRTTLHTLNTSKTKLTKTSTTSSPHPIPPDSSRVPATSVVLVIPSSRVVIVTSSSSPPTPVSPPAKLSSSSASPRTSSRAVVVNPNPPKNPPLPPASIPIHPTTQPSEPSPTTPEAPNLPNIVPPVRPAVPSSASVTASKGQSPVAQSSGVSVTKFPTGSGTHSTTTTTLTETPVSTFSTPVSITETTDSHVTITAPPFVTTTGLSTLPDGSAVTVTHVIANPTSQDISGSSNGDSFFRNHAAVVGVFIASGFVLAGLVLLAFCCFRRQQRRAQRRGLLPEISYPRPIQNPFADVTGNPEMREEAGPSIRWRGFMHPRGPASTSQSLFSIPVYRSEDSLPVAHDAPVPPLPAQRAASRSSHRSSYRVPVPYAGVGNDTRVENRPSTGAPSEHLQIQIAPPSNAPPQLPMRSPLRLLAAQNIARITRENALELSLSRVSSRSVYSPSLHRPDAGVDTDSLYQEKEVVASLPSSSLKREPSGWLTRGLSYGAKSGQGDRVDGNAEPLGAQISPVDSDGTRSLAVSASSSSHAHYSPLESPTSETSTALTSIHDGLAHNRKVAIPRTPPAALLTHRKSGAQLARAS